MRSDRGTHFVNEIIEELFCVLILTGVFTPPYRPQANSMEEWEIWSVALPIPTHIVKSSYKLWLDCRPNDLAYLVPPSSKRDLFDLFRPVNETVAVST